LGGHVIVGSITSCCSGKEPGLLPRSSSRGGRQTRHERAAEIEPNVIGVKTIDKTPLRITGTTGER